MKHFDLVELVLSAHNASAGYDAENQTTTFISNKSFGASDIIETLRAKGVMCFKINHNTVMVFDTEL
mgnify:CR=1 FL=1